MRKGVPQDSIVGPMLSSIFINGLIYIAKDVRPLYNYAEDYTPALFIMIWMFWAQTLKKALIKLLIDLTKTYANNIFKF